MSQPVQKRWRGEENSVHHFQGQREHSTFRNGVLEGWSRGCKGGGEYILIISCICRALYSCQSILSFWGVFLRKIWWKMYISSYVISNLVYIIVVVFCKYMQNYGENKAFFPPPFSPKFIKKKRQSKKSPFPPNSHPQPSLL